MKNKLLFTSLVVFFSVLFSNNIFAQRISGGSADGSGANAGGSISMDCTIQPEPVSFKRNNGGKDGNGTCGIDGQIRLSFNGIPSEAPVLVALMYQDGTNLNKVFLPIYGDVSELAKKGYVSYCLMGSNIDPAKKLVAVFHFPGGCQADIILSE